MTDEQFSAYQAKVERATQLNAEILPHNKQVLFEALASAGIATVEMNFDGYGDSGSIEDTTAFDGNNHELALPTAEITIKTVVFDTGAIKDKALALGDYIESIAMDFLEETHCGWENNDGAYGRFLFSLEKQTITLEYNERYVQSDFHEHAF
jgi:hypothetical protein